MESNACLETIKQFFKDYDDENIATYCGDIGFNNLKNLPYAIGAVYNKDKKYFRIASVCENNDKQSNIYYIDISSKSLSTSSINRVQRVMNESLNKGETQFSAKLNSVEDVNKFINTLNGINTDYIIYSAARNLISEARSYFSNNVFIETETVLFRTSPSYDNRAKIDKVVLLVKDKDNNIKNIDYTNVRSENKLWDEREFKDDYIAKNRDMLLSSVI